MSNMHFVYEEAALAEAHDPGYQLQRAQHQALLLQTLANLRDGSEDPHRLARLLCDDLIANHAL